MFSVQINSLELSICSEKKKSGGYEICLGLQFMRKFNSP